MKRAATLVAALALTWAASAEAHDFWLEPTTKSSEVGKPLSLRLLIGHGEDRTEYARNPKHIRSFRVHGPDDVRDVPGTPGETAGQLEPKQRGLHVVTYASHPSFTQLDHAAFLAYLEEEGLTATLKQVKDEPTSARPVRESFARCAKALIAVGGAHAGKHDQVIGMDLELVPETNPFALAKDKALPVRLLLRGKPLPNAHVAAYRRTQPDRVLSARTDAKGRARLPLDGPGDWLIKCVHIERAPRRAAEDWRSLWATLTFETQAATKP
ncbi:MAG: DUF4198 domain-containing protein [Planctomycetota bacterium]|nr:DUF4198 domain-containing protein [Planctomycetota bacterium]